MKTSFFSTFLFCLFLIVLQQTAAAQGGSHKIKTGETLSLLAKRYNTTIKELIRLNPWSEKGLQIGQELKLPGQAPVRETETASSSDGIHRVGSGESLSLIARKYGVRVSDLEQWNKGLKPEKLKIGQELIVRNPGGVQKTVPAESFERSARTQPDLIPKESPGAGNNIHTVAGGESLSSIARKTGSSVAEIKKANNLKSDQLKLGQQLQIPATTKMNPDAKSNDSSQDAVRKPEAAPKSEPVAKQAETTPALTQSIPESVPVKLPAESPAAQPEKLQAGIREVNNTLGYTRIVETGFAETIDGEGNSKKHLCLHKSAPIGSILQVKNEVNGQSVFVKVIGKLPDTGSNERIIIRISRQAYDRIMASGKRFPVEVSYPESQP